MWVEFIFGLFFYKILSRFFVGDDELTDVSSDSDLFFAVAASLERIYGGKAFVGLRIPDAETRNRQHIDVVLVTKSEVMVLAVRNFDGFLEIDGDGKWKCTKDAKHKPEIHQDPGLEVSKQVTVLESYIEQRGTPLPKGYIVGKILLPNPNCRAAYSIASHPEVFPFDKWSELKPESRSGLSNWIRDAVGGGKRDTPDSLSQKLYFILSTSPMWDRIELKDDRNILGEYLEFKGDKDDMLALKTVKRSKVGQIIVQKPSMLGLGRSRFQVLISPRDFRNEGSSSSEWNEIAVKPTMEVLFQPLYSKKAKKIKLSSIVSVTLSA